MGVNGPNGSGVVAFPQRDIPMLGQAFEITGFLITAAILCKCDPRAALPLLVTSNAVTACPRCQQGYVVQGTAWKAGEAPNIHVAIVLPSFVAPPA